MGTVAEELVDALGRAGVRRVYGIVGDSLNSVVDAVRRSASIEWVSVRHEEVAAFAAGAEAQVTGGLAACAGSCGPGNLHLINGLFDSHRSYAAVVAIAAQIPSAELGTSFFQETHPERLFRECSHYCELVAGPEQMPRVADIAIETALQKRGVSVIVLPGDVALEACAGPSAPSSLTAVRPQIRPSDEELDRLASLLNAAERVTMFCGAGCAGAHAEVLALADALRAPIVHTLRGKQHVEWDNPFDVGMTGLLGLRAGYQAIEECDALLLLGTDFPYDAFYPKGAKIAQIDVRPENLGRRTRLDIGLVGDVRATLPALLPRLHRHADETHLSSARRRAEAARSQVGDHVAHLGSPGAIHPQFVASQVSALAAPTALFTVDTGMTTVWAARYLKMAPGRGLIGSFSHGSMANALPQAIGAQAADRTRQVVSLSGDGGLGMLLGDLLSLVEHELPVKVVVFNNSTLGMVKLEMQVAGIPNFGTDFKPVRFDRIAEAAGIRSFRVERSEEVAGALTGAFAHPGPALVDVVTTPYQLALPPDTGVRQAWGVGLFALREVALGHARDVIDEVLANL
ncbi:MAG TPA: ubiquinone-dependent pyruvate dehydrogenase [Thermoplasmata archaeon]|nr:ubiquinone-dependent pyruvate dehydrogenase [Thermoplasmata archaeon]